MKNYIFSKSWAIAIWLTYVCLPASAQIVNPFTQRFQTNDTGDIRFIGNTVMTCQILDLSKTSQDLNGGNLLAGDIIRYTIQVINNGSTNATDVILTDAIPSNTTYVANSIRYSLGSNPLASITDVRDTDIGEIISNNITVRSGTSATSISGGVLSPNQIARIQFDVRVNSTVTTGRQITNRATVNYSETNTSALTSGNVVNTVGSSTSSSSSIPDRCENARANIGTTGQNNNYFMRYVDIDSDPTTFSSSSADLNLPSGSTILFAGLYWGGDSSNSARSTVRIATPASGYTSVSASALYSTDYGSGQTAYQAFADVTTLVGAGGNGTYTVANVQSSSGSTNRWGGWSLVIAYRAPGEQARNLTVFDGFARVSTASGGNSVNIPISGFIAPPSGQVKTKLGVIGYEGDSGLGISGSYTGDRFRFRETAPTSRNFTDISNSVNPANDIFNSSISYLGSHQTAKNPNYLNQLGYDADIFDASGRLGNGATAGEIQVTTGGETYLPGVVTSAIDLYAPNVVLGKTYTDLNGGDLEIGDILEYTVVTTNNPDASGNGDPANESVVLDPIPAFTTYIPNSLQIDGVAKTDASGDDQAEFDSAANATRFRLGTGANATTGGRLTVNQNPPNSQPTVGSSSTIKFRVAINPNTPDNTEIINQAQGSYKGQTLGQGVSLGAASPTAKVKINIPDGVSINKTDSPEPVTAGNILTYKITVTNSGPATAPNLEMKDPLPLGTAFNSLNAPSGWNCTTPPVGNNGTVSCTIASFGTAPYPNSAEFIIGVKVDRDRTGTLQNTASILSNNVLVDEVTESTTVLAPVTQPRLSLVKRITAINNQPINRFDGSATDPNGNGNTTEDDYWPAPIATYLRGSLSETNVKPGDEIEYTVYFLNSQNPAKNVTICDLIPNLQTFSEQAFNVGGSGDRGIAAVIYPASVTTLPANPLPTDYFSNLFDSDRGTYFPPNALDTPSSCRVLDALGNVLASGSAANTNGAVVVNIARNLEFLPPATARGNPPSSYGFIRFRAVVK